MREILARRERERRALDAARSEAAQRRHDPSGRPVIDMVKVDGAWVDPREQR